MIKKFKTALFILKTCGIKSCLSNYFSILISNACVVSFRKSGRTWLKMMLAKVFALKYGINKTSLEIQMMTLFKPAPNVFFSHGGSSVSNKKLDFRRILKRKKIIFLVRDPRDVIVSLFHDWTKRNIHYEGNISDFIRNSSFGVNKIIDFMNNWIAEGDKRKEDFLLVKYEDMQENSHKELTKILDFLNIKVNDQILNEAIRYSSFENMRKMELTGKFKDRRMRPENINDPNSYKTRKGKVGGYKEELSKEDITYLNRKVKENLNQLFRY